MRYWSFIVLILYFEHSFYQEINFEPIFFVKCHTYWCYISYNTGHPICIANQMPCLHITCNNIETAEFYGNFGNIASDVTYFCFARSYKNLILKISCHHFTNFETKLLWNVVLLISLQFVYERLSWFL